LVLDHKNFAYNENGAGTGSTSISQAITFGDGSSADNDLRLEVLPGGSLDIKSGILDYRNMNS